MTEAIQPVILSAPFGNYLQLAGATSTLGTYTPDPRGGAWYRLWRVARTVRYYPGLGAWKNRLGLPNPGIDALDRWARGVAMKTGELPTRDAIISVTAFDWPGWKKVLSKAFALAPLGVELNVSCPNVAGGKDDLPDVFRLAADLDILAGRTRSIVKLPPVGWEPIAYAAACQGVRNFHACNTLSVPGGGLSGKPVKPIALEVVKAVRSLYTHADGILIGGSGITEPADAREYLAAGATHVAVGTMLFNPLNWWRVGRIAEVVAGSNGSGPLSFRGNRL